MEAVSSMNPNAAKLFDAIATQMGSILDVIDAIEPGSCAELEGVRALASIAGELAERGTEICSGERSRHRNTEEWLFPDDVVAALGEGVAA